MIYSRLSLLLIILMLPLLPEAEAALPVQSVSGAYMQVAFNDRKPQGHSVPGRHGPRPGTNAGIGGQHRNLPPAYNRGFGYGFERRHAQPVPMPSSRRPF
ncbi:MAG: hypothetical protein ACYC3O_12480 [Burkholderiales bacterium]